MRRLGTALYPLVALAFVASGCSKDVFVANDPQITITAYVDEANPYLEYDNDTRVINLGEVPVYGSKKAVFRVDNPTTQNLVISEVKYAETVSTLWGDPTWLKSTDDTQSRLPPLTVPGGGYRLIEIAFAPLEEGEASAKVEILSNASNGRTMEVTVIASGIYHGQSIIELEYTGTTGPVVETDCSGGTCVIPADRALAFGNIGLTLDGTSKLLIRNRAQCDPYPGGDPCNPCSLQVASTADSTLGITFKEGTNDTGCVDEDTGEEKGCFELVGSNVPFEVRQADVDCGQTGEQKVLLTFHAPEAESDHETVLVIESNDPDKGSIELPVTARARNAPLGIAGKRECQGVDVVSGSLILTDCHSEIEPLNRVYFDGRRSCDPILGAFAGNPDNAAECDRAKVVSYSWEVIEAPDGVNPSDYDWAGQNSSIASFWVPIAGHYVVKLTVTNDSGITSGDVDVRDENDAVLYSNTVEFDAVPSSMLHVQLVWDHPANDQDLHMTHANVNPNLCSNNEDCFFSNKQPVWFAENAAGEGNNPRLDKDDTNGLGPENINIDEPSPGTYRVYVHYYPWSVSGDPTVETVRIYLSGVLRFSEMRTLTDEEQVWAVADITWTDDGTQFGSGEVTPFPSTDPNLVGAVAYRDSSMCYSDTGWPFPN